MINEIWFSIPLEWKFVRMILKQIALQRRLELCHKCHELASRGWTRLAINFWPSHKRTGSCVICTSFKEQQKPGRKKKSKPGVKSASNKDVSGSEKQAKIVEGMSGTVSFQQGENANLFCQEEQELKTYRGTEPFALNIKRKFIRPICKDS